MSAVAVALPGVVGEGDGFADRARRKSLCGASVTTLVLVGVGMVVIWPWRMPIASCSTFTTGARQLVVQDAAVSSRCRAGSERRTLTPTTMLRAPASLTGAATMTVLTPRAK